ncbi:unnamed protein product [Ambrosiozyma monospora]|uniref:Unnamed protein product n=1 Tax=Ambrosiozyma monospora TaxID=43982 RepID=A0A9W6YPS7_AMBMO|nr:unnamed protein product [Ambrosiozyma monospora]
MLIKLILIYALAILQIKTTAEIAPQVAMEDLRMAYAEVVADDIYSHASFYSSYFRKTDLYTKYLSATSIGEEEPFWDRWGQTTLYDLLISMYSALPTSRQSSLTMSIYYDYKLLTSEDSSLSTWESPALTPVSSSSWRTEVPYVTTTGVLSDVYVYAQCDALADDIQNFANIYNNYFDTYTNTKELTSFRDQMSKYLDASRPSQFDLACTSIARFISKLPWQGRIEADARSLFKIYTTEFLSEITIHNPNYHTTTFTDTSVDISNVYQYLLYQQAQYYAVLLDYQSNVDQYTSLMTSYLFYDNHTSEIQDFTSDIFMINKTTSLNSDAYYDVYSNISKVYSLFTWSDRLAYVAKQVYESYNSKYASGSLTDVTATGLSVTANTVTSIIPSAMPALTSNVVTATATASIKVTNVFPVVVLDNSTATNGQTKSSISQTTITLVENVKPSMIYTNGTHATISVAYDLISVMYYGADALMMDFQNTDSQSAYTSYINQHLGSPFVSSYISVLNSCSTKNMFNPSSTTLYTEVLAGFYNFIFNLPSQFRPKLLDILGYAYMNSITATTPMTLSNYQEGGGALFNSIFGFGGLDEYGQTVLLTTIRVTRSDGLVFSVESTVTTSEIGGDVGGQNPLIFPTALSVDLTATSTQEPEYLISYVTIGRPVSDADSLDP